MSTEIIITAAGAIRDAIGASEDTIESLDRAIGDGDHYHNVKRGAETVAEMSGSLAGKDPDQALKAIAMKLMSTIGGASGPLMSSFFLAMSKAEGVNGRWDLPTFARLFRAGVEGIRSRGKADLGDKTMLDVLIPVAATLEEAAAEGAPPVDLASRIRETAEKGMLATRDISARFGRAAFLGERAIGHIDPGAMSCKVMIGAVCDAVLGEAA